MHAATRVTGTVWLGLALMTGTARSAVYYVAKHGSDGGAGAPGDPWQTIQFAVTNAAVADMDEIRIGEGVYVESVANDSTGDGGKNGLILKGGYNTNDWSWDPANHATIIQSPSTAQDCIYLRGSSTNTIAGLVLTGGRYGVYSYSCGTLQTPRETQHQKITHCVITNNANHGVRLFYGRNGVRAENCLIADNGGDGIRKYVDNGGDSYVYNCTIADNAGAGYEAEWNYTHTRPAYIKNCIIAGNGYGVRDQMGHATYLEHSCVYGNAGGNIQGTLVYVKQGMIGTDPKFAGSGDYRLASGSPCAKTGADLSGEGITDDLEATARSGAFDMGCYQSAHAALTRHADTYVDAAGGSDANAGTSWAAAKATIGAALPITADNGTCHVASGQYGGEVYVSGYGVTLEGTNWLTCAITNPSAGAVWLLQTNTTLRGFTIMGAQYGVTLPNSGRATNTLVEQCIVRNNTNGIRGLAIAPFPAQYYRLSHCIISNNVIDGVNIFNGKDGLIARNCLVADNGGDGIEILVDNGSYQYLYNCTISGNGNGLYASHNPGYTRPFTLRNCTVSHNSGSGILRNGTYKDVIDYSCFYGNTTWNFDPAKVTLGAGMQYTDPLFVGGGDYHIQSGSPCVDNGTDLTSSGVTNDLEGTARAVPFDIGCYQSPYSKPQSYLHIYVDGSAGNDANSGTNWANAKQTIANGLSFTLSNGTCHVAAGTYNEEVTLDTEGVTLEGVDWTFVTIAGSGGNTVSLQAHRTTVRNVTVEGGLNGVLVASGGAATNTLVDHCIIRGNTYGVGYQYSAPTTTEPIRINRCVITNNSSHGIYLSAGKDYLAAVNCLIAANGGGGFYTPQDNSASHYLVNCTIADNAGNGLTSAHNYGYYASMFLKNCILSGNGGYASYRQVNNVSGYDQLTTSCVYGNGRGGFTGPMWPQGGVIAADPLFAGGGDYRLQAGSPCAKTGTDLSGDPTFAVTNDLDGNPRAAPCDMGCYESAHAAPVKHADTYADAVSGSDANAGTSPGAAKQTIGAALAVTAPSGTCHVASGAYAEEVFLGPIGVTLQGAGADSTVVSSAVDRAVWYQTLRWRSSNWFAIVNFQAQGLTLSGLDIDGGENGIAMNGGSSTNQVVENCLIRNCLDGIGRGSESQHRRLVLRQCRIVDNDDDGIDMLYNMTVEARNCVIAGNGGTGVRTQCDNPAYPGSFIHCTIADNTNSGFRSYHPYDQRYVFTNCIVSGNGEYGIAKTHTYSSPNRYIYVGHSCAYANATNFYSLDPTRIVVGNGMLTNQPPLFEPGSYMLSDLSPCVDAGTNAGVYVDLAGTTRPLMQGFDMGAYELPPPLGTLILVK